MSEVGPFFDTVVSFVCRIGLTMTPLRSYFAFSPLLSETLRSKTGIMAIESYGGKVRQMLIIRERLMVICMMKLFLAAKF